MSCQILTIILFQLRKLRLNTKTLPWQTVVILVHNHKSTSTSLCGAFHFPSISSFPDISSTYPSTYELEAVFSQHVPNSGMTRFLDFKKFSALQISKKKKKFDSSLRHHCFSVISYIRNHLYHQPTKLVSSSSHSHYITSPFFPTSLTKLFLAQKSLKMMFYYNYFCIKLTHIKYKANFVVISSSNC